MNHPKYYCIYFGRRDRLKYKYSYDEIKKAYPFIQMHERMSDVLSGAMGNEFYIARFEFYEDMLKFQEMVSEKE